MVQKIKRTANKSPEQALAALMRLCAAAERSSGDALRLMRGWGVAEPDARRVLDRLTAERFIDDARYACAFVRDRMNLSGWGRYKIESALRAKGIAPSVIADAMAQTAGTDMRERLSEILARRMRTLKAASPFDARSKLLRYALSQGYDFDTARECVERCIPDTGEGEGVFFS